MKAWIPPQGTMPHHPDFGMLKAALIAAQAATPTARASTLPAEMPVDVHAALHALFASEAGDAEPADRLGHRFGSTPASDEDGHAQR